LTEKTYIQTRECLPASMVVFLELQQVAEKEALLE
jgi:hypothetical protein